MRKRKNWRTRVKGSAKTRCCFDVSKASHRAIALFDAMVILLQTVVQIRMTAVEGMVRPGQVDLLVVDEADRLKPLALEVLRDMSDRSPMGLILVGMPGLEKRLARYPRLYSRVGFVHQYRTFDRQEQQELIEQQVRSFGGGGAECAGAFSQHGQDLCSNWSDGMIPPVAQPARRSGRGKAAREGCRLDFWVKIVST